MPKLKSIIAGLAVSTALSGGVIGLGAATTATSADAATSITSSASTLTGCYRATRCGGGWRYWRHHRLPRIRIIIVNRNKNKNRNLRTTAPAPHPTEHVPHETEPA
jgi:hypothetical protein